MKNKKHKKRTYKKSERSSETKKYLSWIGGQLKRPIQKKDKWIDKKSVILAVIFGIVMAGTAVAVGYLHSGSCFRQPVSIPLFTAD